ncbi:hypothetical protein HPP92_026725 [Vanilla planifolia]|uniref:Uncharacterized protein n=1 Tax=Vanilla planifolia TaxID=51239 RepID=A0A835PEC9_VANPL|nr:hypothetical protein HPP92_026725 [Vanilla planifolia]
MPPKATPPTASGRISSPFRCLVEDRGLPEKIPPRHVKPVLSRTTARQLQRWWRRSRAMQAPRRPVISSYGDLQRVTKRAHLNRWIQLIESSQMKPQTSGRGKWRGIDGKFSGGR